MFIYKITNKISGLSYVGQTINSLEKRFQGHVYQANLGSETYLHKSMRKSGVDNFTIELLETCDKADLNKREQFWIDQLETFAPKGYNLTKGGDGGDTSASHNYQKGMAKRDYSGPNNPMYGKDRTKYNIKYSEESKAYMSEQHKKAWEGNEERKKRASERVLGKNNPMYGKTPSNASKIEYNGVLYNSIAEATRKTSRSAHYIKKNGKVVK